MTSMTFEQPANLRALAGKPARLTWSDRWALIKILLPLVVFSTVLVVEIMLFQAWTRDEYNPWRFVIGILFLPGFLLLLFEVSPILSRLSKRRLTLREKGVGTSPSRLPEIPWERITCWWFQELADTPMHRLVTLEFAADKKATAFRRWSLILEKTPQCDALISELEFRRQRNDARFRVEEIKGYIPPLSVKPVSVASMYLYVAGMWCLIHGAPLLAVSLSHHHSESGEQLTPHQQEKIRQFVQAHFSSAEQFTRFIQIAGGIFTGAGVVLMGTSFLISRKLKASSRESSPTS